MIRICFDETYDVNAKHHSLFGVCTVASMAMDGLTCLRNKYNKVKDVIKKKESLLQHDTRCYLTVHNRRILNCKYYFVNDMHNEIYQDDCKIKKRQTVHVLTQR